MEKECRSCRQYLGGGQCRSNVEHECREGGGFEAWEPKEVQKNGEGETQVRWPASAENVCR